MSWTLVATIPLDLNEVSVKLSATAFFLPTFSLVFYCIEGDVNHPISTP